MNLEAFVTQMFRCLTDAGIDYCVLRNHEDLPYRNTAADLDLLVNGADLATALACVAGIDGAVVTGRVARAQATHLFVAGVHWDSSQAIEVDFMTRLGWKGISYLDTAGLLARARPAGPDRELIRIPDPLDEAIVSFLSSFLIGGRIKRRYQPFVQTTFAADPGAVAERLGPAFGTETARRLAEAVAAGDEERALAMVPALRRRLLTGALRAKPGATARSLGTHYAREARIRWTGRYTDDVCLIGGTPEERERFARDLAGAVANMAKEVTVVTGSRARQPRRNRALRIWAGPGAQRRRGLLLDLDDPVPDGVDRLAGAREAVRDHLAR